VRLSSPEHYYDPDHEGGADRNRGGDEQKAARHDQQTERWRAAPPKKWAGRCIRSARPRVTGMSQLWDSRSEEDLMTNKFTGALKAGAAALILTTGALGASAIAQEKTVTVGGAPMYPSKTIVENAVNSKDHTTLVAAVKAAGLVDTLSGAGPFTVFAPTNAAFGKLPAGTVDTLVKPESKATLTGILTYHVVPGRLTAADLMGQVKAGNGTATLKTAAGGNLTVKQTGDKLMITDAKGGSSSVTIGDVLQKNGVIHVVDTVLMPS
jgi:uncharacterized surface protein with fasciclin (FAS1) repeats